MQQALKQALVLALLLATPGTAGAIWPFGQSEPAQPLGERAAALLSQAIAIPTAGPEGDEAKLASLYAEVLREAGLEVAIVPTPDHEAALGRGTRGDREHAGGDEPRSSHASAATWARLRGTGAARPIVLLSHLDVVPAGRERWATPPFEGRVTETHVLGRGALDAKGVSVIHLLSIVELARSGVELARDVIFLATPGEETGGRHGAGYITRERTDLLHDAEYLLTEGGAIRVGGDALPVWGVTVTEKSPCWIELSTRGTGGHAAVPMPDAAVPRLIAALERIRRIETPVRVLPEVEEMFRAMAPAAAPEDAAGYRALRDTLASNSRFRRRFLSDPSRSALVRDTISITVLEGADATNAVPRSARARIDARLLRGHDCKAFTQQLATVVGDNGVLFEEILAFEAGHSPSETPLFEAIARVAARRDPRALVIPRIIPGFTDAHYFRAKGIIAYGFTPRWLTALDTQGIHGPDEKVSIANLERGINTLVEIVRELSPN